MSALLDNDAIDAKAQAALVMILARLNVNYTDLTQFERVLWTSAYKIAHAEGARAAIEEARDIIGTAGK